MEWQLICFSVFLALITGVLLLHMIFPSSTSRNSRKMCSPSSVQNAAYQVV